MIYRIDETTSTNDEARDAKYRHGDIVWAERQTAGRGQRGHTSVSYTHLDVYKRQAIDSASRILATTAAE